MTDTAVVFKTLFMAFHLPAAQLARLGPLTLRATINGAEMPACVFDAEGNHEYTATLRPYAAATTLHVEFELDKRIEPTREDARQLGIVVPLDAEQQIRAVADR